MVEKSKPEPDIYLKACEAVGVLPEMRWESRVPLTEIRAVCGCGNDRGYGAGYGTTGRKSVGIHGTVCRICWK